MSAADSQRLFFALWPDPSVREHIQTNIQDYYSVCRGKPVPCDNWHMTLAFLGKSSEQQRACYREVASGLSCEGFTLQLDQCGFFQRARVAWLSCRDTPEALQVLVEQLQASLSLSCGYLREKRPWWPHLSLVRKAQQAPACGDIEPVSWPVHGFSLVSSQTLRSGARYEVLDTWPLSS